MIPLEPANGQFAGEQQAQQVPRPVHQPDGPGLGCAESPRANHRHEVNERFRQLLANTVKLHVARAQGTALHETGESAPDISSGAHALGGFLRLSTKFHPLRLKLSRQSLTRL